MEPIGITIIIGVVAGALIVITFFVTRYFYKSKEKKAVQKAETYKKQYENEMKVREGLCKVAEQAGIDIQTLIELSQKHQEKFQSALYELIRTIHESTATTEKLNQVAISIQNATEKTTGHTEKLSSKLETMQSELTKINQKLINTEKELTEREKELQETIIKLRTLEQFSEANIANQNTIETFFENTAFAYEALNPHANEMLYQEINTLRQENQMLSFKIKELDKVMTQLNQRLKQSNKHNQKHLDTIQSLLLQNKQLSHKIQSITDNLEKQSVHYQPSLFKA